MARRYGDDASITYFDVSNAEVRASHSDLVESIEAQGLLYPVTVVDGRPLYDGAVSYPAIIRAVHNTLLEQETADPA